MNQVWDAAGVPSYSYFFDLVPDESFLDPSTYGVPHFSEIAYVFGNTEAVGWEKNPIPQGPDKADYLNMIELMSRMWISFAASGSPNNHKSKLVLFRAQVLPHYSMSSHKPRLILVWPRLFSIE
jgi:acetylcholinesterase